MCPRTAPAPEAELTPRGRATRDRILTAAAELIHERGVAGTSLDDVRAATGTSKSQLYHYFEDKSALVRAVVQRQVEVVLSPDDDGLDDVSTLAGLQAWRDRIVGANSGSRCGDGCPLGRLTHELADSDDTSRTLLVDGFAGWQSRLACALRRIRDGGELRADADPDALALGLLGAVQGGLLLTNATRSATALAGALDLALAGIRAQQP
jgi:TetR/AcrR family transcriptional repressor of nem operon